MRQEEFGQIMKQIVDSIRQAGYCPYDQIIGYMETGDVSYITRLGNARRLIQTLDKVCVEQYIQDHLPEITGDTQTSTIINEYLNDILSPRLYEYGVSTDFQRRISSVISEQMTSALFHWKEMKEVFYTLTAEEALFYKPEAPDDVKVFVVLTVRNSPIETLQSDYFRQAGLKQKISDEQLKIITSEAIMFFKDIQLCNCDEVKPESDEDDLYGYLRDSYCIAWRTLEQISKCETQSTTFSSFAYQNGDEKKLLDPYLNHDGPEDSSVKVVVDGYDLSIDNTLHRRLSEYAENHGVFYVDCFKMITRNVEKLFVIIDYLMANDVVLLTANYLLEHTTAEKRRNVVRAASSKNPIEDMLRNLHNVDGLTEKHKKYLSIVYI